MARVCSLKRKAWANEQASLQSQLTADSNFKQPVDFEKLDDKINKRAISLDQISSFIGEQKPGFESLKHFVLNKVENVFRLTDEQQLMLLTLACAKLLCDAPKLESWRNVTEIRYHSWEVENWLEPALSYYAEHHNKLKSVTQLAHAILAALVSGELQPKSERNKGIVQEEAESWSRETEPLKEIWFGLRGSRDDFIPYLEFSPVFTLGYQNEPKGFIAALMPLNPYIAKSMLTIAGITFFGSTFANWQQATELIPYSFKKDGTYKKEYKSYLLLILLDAAYQNLLDAKYCTNDEDYVTGLINDVVEVLSTRKDYPGIVMRWGNWLERTILQDTGNHDEFNSSSFIANKLLLALGEKLESSEILTEPAKDFEQWECWTHYSVMSSYLFSGLLTSIETRRFTNDWDLDLFSWGNEKGDLLKQKSLEFILYNESFLGKKAYQLAYPLTKTTNPLEEWISLWESTHALREIVQHGFKASIYGTSYSERNKPSQLLVLCFTIGLALLDLLVTQPDDKDKPTIKELFKHLYSSLVTMLYIDKTINNKSWQSLYRHLAIRRVLWQGETESVFEEADSPNFIEMAGYYKNDSFKLATLLENIFINLNTKENFKKQLTGWDLNIEGLVEEVDYLSEIDSRRYSLDIKELKNALTLRHS